MIIAIASDNGVEVVPLTDVSGAFVLFEVGQASAVRAGYRSNVTNTLGDDKHSAPQIGKPCDGADRTALVQTLSDCTAVVAHEIDMDLRLVLQGKAIDTFVCDEENVDLAARQYAESMVEKYGPGATHHGRNA